MVKYNFNVPNIKKIRLIIDSDTKNEADDQFAIMHALMTPSFEIEGIIATHFGDDRTEKSMEESYSELIKILKISGFYEKVKVFKGSERSLEKKEKSSYFGNFKPLNNEGVRFIISKAQESCDRPLYIAALGPLTDVASALMLAPSIANNIIVVWNGGGPYPYGGNEFNLFNDIAAANIVFSSKAELWQIPSNIYDKFQVSLAELQYKVSRCGKIGEYLFIQLQDFIHEMVSDASWPPGEFLSICDLAVTGTLLNEQRFSYKWRSAPFIDSQMHYINETFNRSIRVYTDINYRFILEDFFAKLAINYLTS